MIEELKQLIRRLQCKLGLHEYKDSNLQSTFISEDYDGMIYRMENRCVYCGKEYCEMVWIPKPYKGF